MVDNTVEKLTKKLHIKYNSKMYTREVPEISNRSWKYELFYIKTPWKIILQNPPILMIFAVPISLQI